MVSVHVNWLKDRKQHGRGKRLNHGSRKKRENGGVTRKWPHYSDPAPLHKSTLVSESTAKYGITMIQSPSIYMRIWGDILDPNHNKAELVILFSSLFMQSVPYFHYSIYHTIAQVRFFLFVCLSSAFYIDVSFINLLERSGQIFTSLEFTLTCT